LGRTPKHYPKPTVKGCENSRVKYLQFPANHSSPYCETHSHTSCSDSLLEDKRALNTKDLHYTKQDICMLHRFIYFQDRLIIEKESGAREGKGKRRRKGMYNIEEDRKR
jgi:hypothetical protein